MTGYLINKGTDRIRAAEYGAVQCGDCRVFVGTSGYSYLEWIENGFYPSGIKNSEMLGQYAYQFETVELNYTWYQMARAEALERLAAKTPSNFRFSAKLTRTLTHEREDLWQERLAEYKAGIEPIRNHLLAILVQLPPEFDRSLSNRKYLARLLDGLSDYPVAVEFRHSSWAMDSVFAELERRKVTLVTVDAPAADNLFPPLDVVTNPDFFYVRFHGRNLHGWSAGNMQHKFNYNYSYEELEELYERYLKTLISNSSKGVLYFNNHVAAHAPNNAKQLTKLLKAA